MTFPRLEPIFLNTTRKIRRLTSHSERATPDLIAGKSPGRYHLSSIPQANLKRLAGTYVENLSWLACAERYDRAHTFFYMDPPYWQTAGYGVDFLFEEYESMADFMRRCKGKVMVSINDHPDIRRVFDCFHFEYLDIRYTNMNQRQGKAEVTGELVIMNWLPASLGGLF